MGSKMGLNSCRKKSLFLPKIGNIFLEKVRDSRSALVKLSSLSPIPLPNFLSMLSPSTYSSFYSSFRGVFVMCCPAAKFIRPKLCLLF